MRFGTDIMLSEYEVNSRQSTDHLVNQHLPLVKRLASQLAVKLPSHIEIEDLIQVGLIGLLKAVEDYQSCLLYTSPSPRDRTRSRMPSSA